ncbi:MAG: DNA repair protein RadA, partial [Porticoccaceae bacterium]|nr:DNA repair protein RadA [Porticoccaceae bacterium]
MARKKTVYVCGDCGSDYSKWQGQCSDCGAWNTLSEMRHAAPARSTGPSGYAGAADGEVKRLSEIDLQELPRIASGGREFDLVLGGGLVPGS